MKLQKSINKFFKWFNSRKFHSFESKRFFARGGERREGREGEEEASVQKWLELPPSAKIVMFPINFTYKWTICCCCCCFFSFDNYFMLIKSQNSVICLHAVQAKLVTYSLHPFNENLTQHLKYRCFSSLFLPEFKQLWNRFEFFRVIHSQAIVLVISAHSVKKYTHHTSPLNHLSCFFYFCSGESATCLRELGKTWEESVEIKGGVKNRKRRNIKMMIKMVHKLENCTCGVIIYNLSSSRNLFSGVQAVTKIKSISHESAQRTSTISIWRK